MDDRLGFDIEVGDDHGVESDYGEVFVFGSFVEKRGVEEVDFELVAVGADVDFGGFGFEDGIQTSFEL